MLWSNVLAEIDRVRGRTDNFYVVQRDAAGNVINVRADDLKALTDAGDSIDDALRVVGRNGEVRYVSRTEYRNATGRIASGGGIRSFASEGRTSADGLYGTGDIDNSVRQPDSRRGGDRGADVVQPPIPSADGRAIAASGNNPRDIDGDGIPNEIDADIDGDRIANPADRDMDGDGIPNVIDPTPRGESGPTTGQPIDPGRPIDPTTGQPVDPATGRPIDPATGRPIDPATGRPIDPATGRPIDPATGRPIDPATGRPIDPATGRPHRPGHRTPHRPSHRTPHRPGHRTPHRPGHRTPH